jgi:hypothetical protein
MKLGKRGVGIVCVLASVIASTGCGPNARGAFTSSGFSSGYGYDVRYKNGQLLLPASWGIDNYLRREGAWVHKDQAGDVSSYAFDDDGDGIIDARFDAPTYALRFENRTGSGVIWLRNVPIAPRLRVKELRVLLQSYVDAIAGASYETARLDGTEPSIVVEKRYAATIVEQGPVTVAGRPGYVATVDIANVDQLKLNPNARERRVQIMLVHAPGEEQADYVQSDVRNLKYTQDNERRAKHYRVLVVAGYSSMPSDFDAGLPDFHDFLGRVTIAGTSGFAAFGAVQPPSGAQPPSATK